jgi:hypothetical protein
LVMNARPVCLSLFCTFKFEKPLPDDTLDHDHEQLKS